MYCTWNPDGGHDCDPCYEHLQGEKVGYKVKRYKVTYKDVIP